MKNFYLAGRKPKRLVSLMLVAASLGLGMRLVTELSVYIKRSRARLCRVRPWPRYGNDDLVRGVAKTRAREQFSACHPE